MVGIGKGMTGVGTMTLSREKERLLQRLKSPRLRRKEGLFLVEGIRGAREFLDASIPMAIRFAVVSPRLEGVSEGRELLRALEDSAVSVHPVDDEALPALSDTETPQGILLVAEEPSDSTGFRDRIRGCPAPRLLILDGLQDPGNVGTLIRSARAFGLEGVAALEGTADPWGPKVVRSGAGSHAHLPILRMSTSEVLAWVRDLAIPLLVAEAGGKDVRRHRPPGGWALVVGNEGGGVRRELRDAASATLSIPMAQGVDSLNAAVAGSLLLYALSSGSAGEDEPDRGQGPPAGRDLPEGT
jgi:TrmH family RNA methyltransferase